MLWEENNMRLHWSKVFDEIINYFKEQGIKIILIGIRSAYYSGIPIFELTQDLDISIPTTLNYMKKTVTQDLRKRGFIIQWRTWGLIAKKDGERIDISLTPITFDEQFLKRAKTTKGLIIPSIEDLIVLKLIAYRRKDIRHLKKIIRQRKRLDYNYLMIRVREAGLEKRYIKLMKRLKMYKTIKVLGDKR